MKGRHQRTPGSTPVLQGSASPAVLEDEEDVVPEGVAVLLQDPAAVVQNLEGRGA